MLPGTCQLLCEMSGSHVQDLYLKVSDVIHVCPLSVGGACCDSIHIASDGFYSGVCTSGSFYRDSRDFLYTLETSLQECFSIGISAFVQSWACIHTVLGLDVLPGKEG